MHYEMYQDSFNDFRLSDDSLCIDSGTNMDWMWTSYDLDGDDRIMGGTVDMGCYESIPEPFSVLLEFTSLACLFFLCKKRK